MAKTDDLIDSLARGLQPVRPHALLRLLTKALLPGVLLSGAFILFVHGLRPDIASAMSLPAFWVKSFYPLALAINGICAVLIVARPRWAAEVGRPGLDRHLYATGNAGALAVACIASYGLSKVDFRRLLLVLPTDHCRVRRSRLRGQYLVLATCAPTRYARRIYRLA